jgi:hypothetical protein
LILSSNSAYHGRHTTLKESYHHSKGYFWPYVGVTIQFFLIVAVPGLAFVFALMSIKAIVIKYVVCLISGTVVLYLFTMFFFANYAVLLEAAQTKRFKLSKQLVDGDLFRIVLIYLASGGIFYFIYIVLGFNGNIRALPQGTQYLITSLNSFITLLISPFCSCTFITLYYELKKRKIKDIKKI